MRAIGPDPDGEQKAAVFRRFDIGEHDIDGGGGLDQNFARFLPVCGFEHAVAAIAQIVRQRAAHQDIRFDNQNTGVIVHGSTIPIEMRNVNEMRA